MPFQTAGLIWLASMALGAPQPDRPLLQTERNEVVLDIVVRDKHGRLVRDLRPEELHISDEGTAVQPVSFRLVAPGQDPLPDQPAASKAAPQPRLITFVFEQFGPEGRVIARDGALALLKSAEGANVYFSVFAIGTGIQLIQPFTKDPDLARKAIERITSGARGAQPFAAEQMSTGPRSQSDVSLDSGKAGAWADKERGTEAILSRMISNAVDPSVASGMRAARAAPAIQSLLMLARTHGEIPGRKTLVYFCEGLQVAESQRQQFRGIVEAANRANLSIYPIDVSGLDYQMSAAANQMPLPSLERGQRSSFGTPQVSRGGDIAAPLNARARDLRMTESMDLNADGSRASQRNALFDLASNTGGFLVLNTNDVRKQTRRIAEEALAYYELTYVPPPAPMDGRFRPIAVSVDRPKVTVQTRNGYFAMPRVPGVPMQPFELPLFKELSAEPGRHDFEHRTSVVPLRAVREKVEVAILVEASPGSLGVQEDSAAGVCRMHGAALAVVRDGSGAVVERFARDDPFQAPLNRRDVFHETPWLLEVRTTLAPGAYRLETVMADRQSDRASIQRRVFVVEPWTEGPHVAALTYVRDVITAPPDAHRAFQSGDKAIEPEMEARLPGGKGSAATVYLLASGAAGVPIRVEISVSKDGRDVARGVVYEGPAKSEMPLVSTLNAASLAGGDYRLRVTATQGERSFVAGLPLTIAPWKPLESSGDGAGEASEVAGVSAKSPEEWKASPPNGDQQRLIDAARANALQYARSLPDFMCLQTTRRFEDPSGKQEWRQKDEYSEVLTWRNGVESYDHAGGRKRRKNTETNEIRVSSAGEFGTVLTAIYQPESKAEFRWVRSESIAGRKAEVFEYRIGQENSHYSVYYLGKRKYAVKPALHGVVTIDGTTAETLHLELEVEKLPQVADLRIVVDYDAANVAGRDFLLPSAATLTTRVGPRLLIRNELRFSAYRRFETEAKIEYQPPK